MGAYAPFLFMLNIFRTKTSRETDEFVKSLTADLIKRYPPELDNSNIHAISTNRLTRILEETCEKATEFQKNKNLGIYGKARLGNKFKWALIEAGYKKSFVDMATEAIIIYISKSTNNHKNNSHKL